MSVAQLQGKPSGQEQSQTVGPRLRDGCKRGQGSKRNSIDNVTTVQHSVEVRLCRVRVGSI